MSAGVNEEGSWNDKQLPWHTLAASKPHTSLRPSHLTPSLSHTISHPRNTPSRLSHLTPSHHFTSSQHTLTPFSSHTSIPIIVPPSSSRTLTLIPHPTLTLAPSNPRHLTSLHLSNLISSLIHPLIPLIFSPLHLPIPSRPQTFLASNPHPVTFQSTSSIIPPHLVLPLTLGKVRKCNICSTHLTQA